MAVLSEHNSCRKLVFYDFHSAIYNYSIITFALTYIVNGGYGRWSLNATCNVTCGAGFETWIRKCNKPEPKYGGRSCSQLGESVEYRPCSKKPCIGKYTIVKAMLPSSDQCEQNHKNNEVGTKFEASRTYDPDSKSRKIFKFKLGVST